MEEGGETGHGFEGGGLMTEGDAGKFLELFDFVGGGGDFVLGHCGYCWGVWRH